MDLEVKVPASFKVSLYLCLFFVAINSLLIRTFTVQ